jgi:type VI protein secretion system component Hcp
MILMRLDFLGGEYCDIQGGKDAETKYKYSDLQVGWFPIESMNFGFNAKTESQSGAKTGSTTSQQGGSSGGAAVSAAAGSQAKGDEAFTGINVSRFVDLASTQLMKFAMEDRRKTKSDNDKVRTADFHFLHSVRGDISEKEPKFIFPYLMITLDNVLIKSWNINATGDERPTETLDLWYDKAAMRYYRTKDGRKWIGGDVSGWNQHDNKEWTEAEIESHYFVAPKTTPT